MHVVLLWQEWLGFPIPKEFKGTVPEKATALVATVVCDSVVAKL